MQTPSGLEKNPFIDYYSGLNEAEKVYGFPLTVAYSFQEELGRMNGLYGSRKFKDLKEFLGQTYK